MTENSFSVASVTSLFNSVLCVLCNANRSDLRGPRKFSF